MHRERTTRIPVLDRLYARIKVHPLGCWEWTGALHQGYGVIGSYRADGSRCTRQTHRLVYEDFWGPIPNGLTVDHLCANQRCCWPGHLELVTLAENTRRQWRAGRGTKPPPSIRQSHCPHGHPYTEGKRGKKWCRACARLKWRERNPGAPIRGPYK